MSDVSSTSKDFEPRRIEKHEIDSAAECLAHAFSADDVAMYFVHTEETEHWTMTERMPPGKDKTGFWRNLILLVRSKMLQLALFKLPAEGRRRFTEFIPLLHHTKAEVLGKYDDKSWYLVYIGTKREARGRGYARKLIEFVTKQADAEGQLCYLESSNDINPKIYQKMGFEMIKKIELGRAQKPVVLDIMVRKPHLKEIPHSDDSQGQHEQASVTIQ
ncbi:MAG: hypothetical protein Q9174_002997, partial [Haloplaca sp. 1 TL-2023]